MRTKEKTYFETTDDGREITYKETLGQALFVGVMYTIGYGCFFIAIGNILFVRPLVLNGLLASLAWIGIMLTIVVSRCYKTGIRQHFWNVLGNLVRNRFVQILMDTRGDSVLCFGYRFVRKRHYFLKLRSEGIKSVDWGPGQGNIPGKDNDWNVALRFDVDSVVFDGERSGLRTYIVGPSGDKAGREEFGSRFIEFLQANRINLTLPSARLLGEPAEVVQDLNPLGKVRIGTDEYVAHSAKGIIKKGSSVVIEEIRGTSIYARKTNGPNKAIKETP